MSRRQANLFEPIISRDDNPSNTNTFYSANSNTFAVRTGSIYVFVRDSSEDQLCGLNSDKFSWLMSGIDEGGWIPVRIRPAGRKWFASTD
jgi:hypothetical protein